MELGGWDIGAVAAKTLLYAATLGAAGTVFFLAYGEGLLDEAQRANIRRLLKLELILAAIFSVCRILLLTGSMTGTLAGMFDGEMAGMILQAGEGTAASLRLAGLGLAAFSLSRSRALQGLALLGAGLAAASFAAVGHTRALQPHGPATILSSLHLIGVAFWMGALVPLLLSIKGTPRTSGLLAGRFGRVAVIVVSLLIAAGLGLLWMMSHGHADFWSSGYGRLLATKLLLVASLLGAAAFNKLRLTPRLLQGDSGAAASLRFSIRVEMGVGLLILLTTASFTSLLGPPR